MRANGLPDTLAFPHYEKPRTSWWLDQSTREAFSEAHKRELARMTKARIRTTGEDRTVDTHFGKVR